MMYFDQGDWSLDLLKVKGIPTSLIWVDVDTKKSWSNLLYYNHLDHIKTRLLTPCTLKFELVSIGASIHL